MNLYAVYGLVSGIPISTTSKLFYSILKLERLCAKGPMEAPCCGMFATQSNLSPLRQMLVSLMTTGGKGSMEMSKC
jgi:hypothetical protein